MAIRGCGFASQSASLTVAISPRCARHYFAAGRENPNTLKDPAPSVFLEKFGDNSIDFELVVWSSEMSARPSRYRSDLNFAIEQKFREAGIELPSLSAISISVAASLRWKVLAQIGGNRRTHNLNSLRCRA